MSAGRGNLGALVLTGGASARMGADKAKLDWGGARAVDLCAALAKAVGADPLFTVGREPLGLPHVDDDAPLGGPVGGVIAGARALAVRGCVRALVLAVDAPTIRPEDLSDLLAQPAPGAAFEASHLPLVLDPRRLPSAAASGWSIRRFIEAAGLARIACRPDQAERLRGANTRAERARLLSGFDIAGYSSAVHP
jgi:molybdopterin-guanine dinucleotide biosynthesis protein A